MAIIAAIWLAYQYWRLLSGKAAVWSGSPAGGVDLRIFHQLVREWVDGTNVYDAHRGSAFYPPASHLLLWPLIGWVDFAVARYIWAVTSAAGLCWLAIVLTKASLAQTDRERASIFLLIFSSYASGATIGNGQLGIHVLVALLVGILVLTRAQATLASDLCGAGLMLFALVKPSMTAPFFWLVLMVPGRVRPALLVTGAYLMMTWWALAYQNTDTESLMRGWLRNSSREATIDGYADIQSLLSVLGLSQLSAIASVVSLAATGSFVYLNRQKDLWQLIGVVALMSRFGVHHRWYDDMLVVVAIVTAFRLRKEIKERLGHAFELLLGAAVLSVLAPGGLYLFPAPLKQIYVATQLAIWFGLLFVLLLVTRRRPRVSEGVGHRLSIAAT
jgi:hypothetical protein